MRGPIDPVSLSLGASSCPIRAPRPTNFRETSPPLAPPVTPWARALPCAQPPDESTPTDTAREHTDRHPRVDGSTPRSVHERCTSPNHVPPAQSTLHPQPAQALLLILVYLQGISSRREGLGTQRSDPALTGSNAETSLPSISFQEDAGGSTVGVRRPVRSSHCDVTTECHFRC